VQDQTREDGWRRPADVTECRAPDRLVAVSIVRPRRIPAFEAIVSAGGL
jgi:hypothetical protein